MEALNLSTPNQNITFELVSTTNLTHIRTLCRLDQSLGGDSGGIVAVGDDGDHDDDCTRIAAAITVFPEFPKPGIEARGLFFAPTIALELGAKFVPLRKPRKLPGEVISEEYSLEYGKDRIEMQIGAVEPNDRAIIVDDLIATGGTLSAAVKLLERAGADVIECACVIELPELKGREKLGKIPVFVLVKAN